MKKKKSIMLKTDFLNKTNLTLTNYLKELTLFKEDELKLVQ